MKISTNFSDVANIRGLTMYAFRELKSTKRQIMDKKYGGTKIVTTKYWGKKQYATLEEIMGFRGISKTGEASTTKGLRMSFLSVKASTLLKNIRQVFDVKVNDSRYKDLAKRMMAKLESMTNEEIIAFAEKNKEVINLYFTYNDFDTSEEIDARFLVMAKELGVVTDKELKNTVDTKTHKQLKIDIEYVNLRKEGKLLEEM